MLIFLNLTRMRSVRNKHLLWKICDLFTVWLSFRANFKSLRHLKSIKTKRSEYLTSEKYYIKIDVMFRTGLLQAATMKIKFYHILYQMLESIDINQL